MQFKSLQSFPKSTELSKKDPEKELLKDVRYKLEEVFEDTQDKDQRRVKIMKKVEPFFRHLNRDILPDTQIEEIRTALMGCLAIENRDQFVNKVIDALKPIFDIIKKYPKEYEEARAKIENEEYKYTELNRLVSYEKKDNIIAIHHSIARTIGPKRELYLDAMRKLAKIIKRDPEIEKIEAVSWIVAKAPSLFTRNGFTIEKVKKGPKLVSSLRLTSGTEKDEGREIAAAHISREAFLKIFGDDFLPRQDLGESREM